MYLRDLQDEDFEVAIKVELLKFLWAVEFCITCEIVLQIVQDTIFLPFLLPKKDVISISLLHMNLFTPF